jgi:hypothetical protein
MHRYRHFKFTHQETGWLPVCKGHGFLRDAISPVKCWCVYLKQGIVFCRSYLDRPLADRVRSGKALRSKRPNRHCMDIGNEVYLWRSEHLKFRVLCAMTSDKEMCLGRGARHDLRAAVGVAEGPQPLRPHFAWLLHSLSLPMCETAAAFVERKGRQYGTFALTSRFGDNFGIDSRSQDCARSCAWRRQTQNSRKG